MRRVEDELGHGLRVTGFVEVVHEHLSILPVHFSLDDLGELEQGLQVLERGLVDQLIARIELLVVLAII